MFGRKSEHPKLSIRRSYRTASLIQMLLSIILPLEFLLACPAFSQQRSSPDSTIVVEGRSKKATKNFVDSLTNTAKLKQLSRWHWPICVETVGLPADRGAFVIERVETIAKSVGISIAGKHCEPNIVILATRNADAVFAGIVKDYPRLGSGTDMATPDELHALTTSRAVRWIHASETHGKGTTAPDGTFHSFSASRFIPTTLEFARVVLFVIDPDQIAGVSWTQLADYLTMISLSRPLLSSDFSHQDTILSLYSLSGKVAAAPDGLTHQDRAFLKALYDSDDGMSASDQREQIVRRMRSQLGREPINGMPAAGDRTRT